jgi:transposase
LDEFKIQQSRFGTLTLFSNLTAEAEEIYRYYKSRNNIETMFDAMKNILHADSSYMQDENSLKGWMFINHVALVWYYQIYNLLLEKNLLKKYSVQDIIMHLLEIRKIKIKEEWRTAEINMKTIKLLEKMDINIT